MHLNLKLQHCNGASRKLYNLEFQIIFFNKKKPMALHVQILYTFIKNIFFFNIFFFYCAKTSSYNLMLKTNILNYLQILSCLNSYFCLIAIYLSPGFFF